MLQRKSQELEIAACVTLESCRESTMDAKANSRILPRVDDG